MLIHLVAAGSTADAWVHKSNCNSIATLVISNEEMRDITNIVIFVEDSVILSKGVRKTKKAKQENNKEDLLVCIRYFRCYFLRRDTCFTSWRGYN